MYSREALDLLAFVRQAQRLGFTLDEIKEIVAIKQDVLCAFTSASWFSRRLRN